MPLSFRNLINGNELATPLGSESIMKSLPKNSAKYIKGYASDTALEALANATGTNVGLLKQTLGLETKELDAYDPYHTSDAKPEEFWEGQDGKAVQLIYDENTNTFKRALYTNNELGGYGQNDFWYEDPFIPTFEISFNENTPFFAGTDNLSDAATKNSLKYFIQKYMDIDNIGYTNRFEIWKEFNKVFFKIFNKDTAQTNSKNKIYYITKLSGLDNLNKKMIKYGEDKITITLNEDVSMLAWYITELYNNLVYSYRNQRFMFPDNLLRFDMTIKINDMRNFQMPQSSNPSSDTNMVNKDYIANKDIKYSLSPKSQIVYTLHDCNFDFFESKNYGNDLEIGGYNGGPTYTPQSLSFDIYFKSVTRSSKFPLINNSLTIDAWESSLFTKEEAEVGTKQNYLDNLTRIKTEATPEKKGYLNQLLGKAKQTIANQGLNYIDNLETTLREKRGKTVNELLSQFSNATTINKIEPDNVYNKNFNDRINVVNLGKQLASGLLTDLQDTVRDASNF